MVHNTTLLIALVHLVDVIPLRPPPPAGRGRLKGYSDRLFLKALVIMIVRRRATRVPACGCPSWSSWSSICWRCSSSVPWSRKTATPGMVPVSSAVKDPKGRPNSEPSRKDDLWNLSSDPRKIGGERPGSRTPNTRIKSLHSARVSSPSADVRPFRPSHRVCRQLCRHRPGVHSTQRDPQLARELWAHTIDVDQMRRVHGRRVCERSGPSGSHVDGAVHP